MEKGAPQGLNRLEPLWILSREFTRPNGDGSTALLCPGSGQRLLIATGRTVLCANLRRLLFERRPFETVLQPASQRRDAAAGLEQKDLCAVRLRVKRMRWRGESARGCLPPADLRLFRSVLARKCVLSPADLRRVLWGESSQKRLPGFAKVGAAEEANCVVVVALTTGNELLQVLVDKVSLRQSVTDLTATLRPLLDAVVHDVRLSSFGGTIMAHVHASRFDDAKQLLVDVRMGERPVVERVRELAFPDTGLATMLGCGARGCLFGTAAGVFRVEENAQVQLCASTGRAVAAYELEDVTLIVLADCVAAVRDGRSPLLLPLPGPVACSLLARRQLFLAVGRVIHVINAGLEEEARVEATEFAEICALALSAQSELIFVLGRSRPFERKLDLCVYANPLYAGDAIAENTLVPHLFRLRRGNLSPFSAALEQINRIAQNALLREKLAHALCLLLQPEGWAERAAAYRRNFLALLRGNASDDAVLLRRSPQSWRVEPFRPGSAFCAACRLALEGSTQCPLCDSELYCLTRGGD